MTIIDNPPPCNLTDDELRAILRDRGWYTFKPHFRAKATRKLADNQTPRDAEATYVADRAYFAARNNRWFQIHRAAFEMANKTHAEGQRDALNGILDRLGGLVDISEPMTQYKEGAIAALTAVKNLAESLMDQADEQPEYPYKD